MQLLTSKVAVKLSATLRSPFKCFVSLPSIKKRVLKRVCPICVLFFSFFLSQQMADLIVISFLYLMNFGHPRGTARCFKLGAEK